MARPLQHFLLRIVYMPLYYDFHWHWGGGQRRLYQPSQSPEYYRTWHSLSICSHFHHLPPLWISVIVGMPRVLKLWWVPVRAPLPLNKCQNEDFSTVWKVVERFAILKRPSWAKCHITFWAGKATRIWMHLLSVSFSFNLQDFQKKNKTLKMSFRSKNLGFILRCVHIMPSPVPHSLCSIMCKKFSKSSTLYSYWFCSCGQGLAGKYTPDCQQGCLVVMWRLSEALNCSNSVICELMNVEWMFAAFGSLCRQSPHTSMESISTTRADNVIHLQ